MKSTKIKDIVARQLIDCKCRPMIEVDVITEGGSIGRASAPTGSSVGKYESYVLRDNNPGEYNGLSVHIAINNINNIIRPALIGMDVTDQRAIDSLMIHMDGTPNKSTLGGNTIYSVSVACIRAAANIMNMSLYKYIAPKLTTIPIPSFNFINGGNYGSITQSFNEFIMIPYKAKSIFEAVEIGVILFQELGKVISNSFGEANIGHSFGWAAPSDDPEVIMELMQEAVNICGYNDKVGFALDCASSEMYNSTSQTYFLKGKQVDSNEIITLIKKMNDRYNFVFVEDILDEDDWNGFTKAVKELPRTIILGDDLIVTDIERLKKAHYENAANGFIFKPNQVGTLTEAFDAHNFALNHNMITVPSGRSGGVVGDVIIDLAVGLQVGFIKNGAPRTGERIDKVNFLMRVASEYPHMRLYDLSKHLPFEVAEECF